jgi:hypothetical protein
MDEQHDQGQLRDVSTRAASEVIRGWWQSLVRLHKHPAVRKHVRLWLLGLISFGPIR